MRPALAELVKRAERLYEDVDLTAVHHWKDAVAGRRALGAMPVYVPRELIHAAGMLPVSVFGGGDQIEIIRGDAYFQSYICHIPRSTIELAITRRFDALDGMLFPSTCDVIRNLSGMWTMLFPNLYVRYVDVPQNFDRSVGGKFWLHELRSLLDDFARLVHRDVRDEDVARSIEVYNCNRRAIRDLYRLRSERPWMFPTSETYLFLRAGAVLPPEEHTQLLQQYTDAVMDETERAELDSSRVVIVGTFCEQPPLALLRTLERAGCWIVDDDLLLGLHGFVDDVEISGDPVRNLADAFLELGIPTASRYEPGPDKGAALVASVQRHNAEGVIFCAPSFCDPALLDQPMLIAALERAGIPHTQFKYAENTGQFGAIREQAGTFSDSIRLWSEA